MKKIKFLSLLLLILIAGSCSIKNDEFLIEEENLILVDSNPTRGGDSLPVSVNFARALAWSAYITGIILQDPANSADRATFEYALSGGAKQISFENLLGPNPIDNGGFKIKFVNILAGYLGENPINDICPGSNDDEPDQPIVDGGDLTVNGYTQFFMDFLLEENCLEFYFPDGLDLDIPLTLTTLGHPLTSNYGNEGIKRYPNPSVTRSTCDNLTNPVWVVPNYIFTGNVNIIVARPYRTSECGYFNYPFSFTDFLSGPY